MKNIKLFTNCGSSVAIDANKKLTMNILLACIVILDVLFDS